MKNWARVHAGCKLDVTGKGTVALADCFPNVTRDFAKGHPNEIQEPSLRY